MIAAKTRSVEEKYLKKVPGLRPGDVVRVHQKIKEGNKERIQVFEGVVLRVKGGGLKSTFLVRKISFGIGVEKNFLLHSPNIAKIEVKKRSKVRQAYLTYLRDLRGKSARLKDKQFDMLAVNIKEEIPSEVSDADITELNEEEMEDVVPEEVSLEVVEEAEEKKAKKEEKEGQTEEDILENHQQAEAEEIEEGLEKAESDAETGEDREGKRAEKTKEETTEEEIKEEVAQEKESKVD